MNAKVMSSRLIVTGILAALGAAATAGCLAGCSSKSPLGSVGGDGGPDVSSGSGGTGSGGNGTGGTAGSGGAGGAGGQSCPARPGAEGSACTAEQDGCTRCAFENVTCCRDIRVCRQGVWSRLEAGPCPPDAGSGDTAPDDAAPVGPCPATSPGNSGAICAIDEKVFCFYGAGADQEQCQCLGAKATVNGQPVAPPWHCSTTPCQRMTAGCPLLPPATNVMCTAASSCEYCCGGGTEIATCTCQPGQPPTCRWTGSCGG